MTRIEEERIDEMLRGAEQAKKAGIGHWKYQDAVVTFDLIRSLLLELKELRAQGGVRDANMSDAVTAELLAEHSGCGHGIQIEQVTARLAPGDAVYVVRGKLGQTLLVPKSDRITPLYAHPPRSSMPTVTGEIDEGQMRDLVRRFVEDFDQRMAIGKATDIAEVELVTAARAASLRRASHEQGYRGAD